MGAACCVASSDRTIRHGSSGEILHRNIIHSPTRSFRWDNRVGVAGEYGSLSWLSNGINRSDMSEMKSAANVSPHASGGGNPLENYQTGVHRNCLMSEASARSSKISALGHSSSRNISMGGKEPAESPQIVEPASVKPSPAVQSVPSISISLVSPQDQLLPPPTTPSTMDSPSMNSISEDRLAPYGLVTSGNESTMETSDRPLDGWSAHAFSELMSASHRESWSFNSESFCSTRDKISSSSHQKSRSASVDFQSCGLCSKLLTEKSPWSNKKIITGNELSVVGVLVCGHVYHAECLENMTPELNKYDPACPICTFGEKQAMKLSGKMLKAEKDLKCKSNKRSQVLDTGASFDFDHGKRDGSEGRNHKLSFSSSLKSSVEKPFSRWRFWFGSRSSKSTSESHCLRKKGLFWVKSSSE